MNISKGSLTKTDGHCHLCHCHLLKISDCITITWRKYYHWKCWNRLRASSEERHQVDWTPRLLGCFWLPRPCPAAWGLLLVGLPTLKQQRGTFCAIENGISLAGPGSSDKSLLKNRKSVQVTSPALEGKFPVCNKGISPAKIWRQYALETVLRWKSTSSKVRVL